MNNGTTTSYAPATMLADYQEAQAAWYEARTEMDNAQAEIRRFEQLLDDAETEVVANGGIEGFLITGSNEAARKAQAANAIAHTPAVIEAREILLDERRQKDRAEADMERATQTMRRCRLALDYAIAVKVAAAAAAGSPEYARQH